jgi:hypothetical protein
MYYFTTLDSEAMTVVKLADEDMVVGVHIGMLALFYRHSSHGLLYFWGLYGYTLS